MSSDELRRLSKSAVADALDAADPTDPTDPTVVGVLLAAGGSSRFGDANKLLADLDGDPLVRHAARTLRNTEVSAVVVVLGHESETVREALAGPTETDSSEANHHGTNGDGADGPGAPLRFVTNPNYEQGLSRSVRTGVDAAVDAGADAVVFLPGDMPSVDPATVDLLVDAYRSGVVDAVAASHDGRRGNPALFGSRHFPALREVCGDVGGKSVLLDAGRGAVVETDDRGVRRDIDTHDDLERHR